MKGWKAVALFVIIFLFAVMVGYNGLQTIQEEWEVIQQQKTAKEKPETSQAPWQQEAWKQLQEEFSKSAQEREAVESAENQTENHIKSNVDYASYLVMTASPHIIVDSNGFRYIVGSFKNTSSVEFDSVDVWFALYDKEGNRIDDTLALIHNLLPGKTWKYKEMITNKEASYFEIAEINVYVDEE